MTASTPGSKSNEALDWLRLTSRILSGDIAPNEARAMLDTGGVKTVPQPQQASPASRR